MHPVGIKLFQQLEVKTECSEGQRRSKIEGDRRRRGEGDGNGEVGEAWGRRRFLQQQGLQGRRGLAGLETIQTCITFRSAGTAAVLSQGNPGSLFDVEC